MHFSGTLSLENSRGFAQISSPSEITDFSECSSVRLRVKGDGRTPCPAGVSTRAWRKIVKQRDFEMSRHSIG